MTDELPDESDGYSGPSNNACEHCGEQIGAVPVWYRGKPYHHRCAFVGYCELCGIEIKNDANLVTVEYNGVSVKACPGCRGASGGAA